MAKTVKTAWVTALLAALLGIVFYGVQFGKTPELMAAESPAASLKDAAQTAARLCAAAENALGSGSAKRITLSNDGSAAVPGARVQGNTVTVTAPGIYAVSGQLTNGQLAVDCDGMVTLILDGVEITNEADAAIRVLNADHTLIYLPEGSENRLVSGTEREITAAEEDTDASGAALYARDDLSIAGSGKLTVNGYINNAVATTDRMTVLSGEITLTAVNNGLKGKDAVTVLGGTISIRSGNDGVKSGSGANTGSIDVRGGVIDIVSFGDGMDAEKTLTISEGILHIAAGDISAVTAQPAEAPPEMPAMGKGMDEAPPQGEQPPERGDPFGGQGFGRPDGMRGQGNMHGGFPDGFDREQRNDPNSSVSTKGLKSGGDLTVTGGSVIVTSADDCVHANASVAVSGGTLLLASGDDGLHADDTVTLSGGEVTILQAYEGIEGLFIEISGGLISVTASDDGINASGGEGSSGFGRMPEDAVLPSLRVSGGTLSVNAEGDGLDSNGDLIVEGGIILVDGPTSGGNGALDSGMESGGRILCNGGTVLAIGSSRMAETFGSDSAQCSFIQNYSETFPAGTRIVITDENGETLLTHTSAKSFDSIVFSSPLLTLGKTYPVSVGGQTERITIESVSNGDSFGFGMPGSDERRFPAMH